MDKSNRKSDIKIFSNGCMLNIIKAANDTAESVIILLHGGPGAGAKSLMEISAFQRLEKHFSVIYFDQRGCGKSFYDLNSGLTIEQITDDIKCVVNYARQQFKDKPVYIMGNSFGGLLALLFLQRYKTVVDKAIISSPSIWFSKNDSLKFQIDFLKKNAKTLFPASLAQKTVHIDSTAEGLMKFLDSPEMVKWFSKFTMPVEGNEGIWHYYAMRKWIVQDLNIDKTIASIEIPTLFLQGIEDSEYSAQELINMIVASKNRNVLLSVFNACGHQIYIDREDSFVRICTEYCLG